MSTNFVEDPHKLSICKSCKQPYNNPYWVSENSPNVRLCVNACHSKYIPDNSTKYYLYHSPEAIEQRRKDTLKLILRVEDKIRFGML